MLFQNLAVADSMVTEIIALQNRPVAEIQPLLAPLLDANEVATGDGFNLIVKASPERLEEIRKLIDRLDTRPHNLLISVLQTSNQTADQLNAEAAIAASPSTIRMHGMAADTREFASQRTAQQLRTLEGQPAHIQVGQVRPVQNYHYGYLYPGVGYNTQFQEAGTGFAVVPHLQGSDQVTIDIAPWSDRFLSNNWISTQSMQTTVRTHLGQWVEIGGVGGQTQTENHGFNYSTQKSQLKILIKVDLAD
ncbi:type II and III secretion system protein [Methylomonas sp. MgM2]